MVGVADSRGLVEKYDCEGGKVSELETQDEGELTSDFVCKNDSDALVEAHPVGVSKEEGLCETSGERESRLFVGEKGGLCVLKSGDLDGIKGVPVPVSVTARFVSVPIEEKGGVFEWLNDTREEGEEEKEVVAVRVINGLLVFSLMVDVGVAVGRMGVIVDTRVPAGVKESWEEKETVGEEDTVGV